MSGRLTARASYVLRRTLRAVAQGPFGAVTITTTIALALVAVGTLWGTGTLLRRGIALWSRDLRFAVLLTDDCSEAGRDALAQKLGQAAPGEPPRFVPRADALRAMRASFGELGAVLDDLPENPLRDALELPASQIADGHFVELGRALAGLPCVADVDYGAQWLGPAQRLLRALTVGLGALFGLIVIVTLVLVSNTCQLAIFARRDEIGVLKLVGATDAFVRWPFLLEGLFEGLFGGALAAAVLTIGFAFAWPRALLALPPLASLGPHPFPLWHAALAFVALGGLLGFVASGLSVGRFLRI